MIKKICDAAEVPVIGAGNVKRMEDVKKLIYAGCRGAVLNFKKPGNREILEEVSRKFGKEKILVYIPDLETFDQEEKEIGEFAGMVFCDQGLESSLRGKMDLPVLVRRSPALRRSSSPGRRSGPSPDPCWIRETIWN